MQKDLLPDYLHLFHAFEFQGSALVALLESFQGDPRRARAAGRSELLELGFGDKAVTRLGANYERQIERDIEWASTGNNHILCYVDPEYPALLRQISDFPPLLYISGDPALLHLPQIAIVGSRLCTPGGATAAFEFACNLAQAGFGIVSGLALGIDAEAHRGALQAGGATVAVIATGADLDYPASNRALAARIRESALLVSEFALGSPARRAHFPRRNRIISGLAHATLVVEAARRSGSLITAGLAADQGREVFALPGSIHNPQARGCHDLIRDGAMLVETPSQIIETLQSTTSIAVHRHASSDNRPAQDLDRDQRRLLDAIGYDPVHSDVLLQRSGLTIEQLSSMLLVLELHELIRTAPGGCYVRT